MSTITVTYDWSVPDSFTLNFEWKVVTPPPPPVVPTIITAGPRNSLNRPTLIYPNGGESILTREIEISWKEPVPASNDKLQVWYEIYFSENYDYFTEPDWKMIATVPVGFSKYLWKVGNSIKSKNVRVAVRSVNSRGERSDYSISAASFSIRRSLPVTPAVLSPIPSQRYGTSVQFIFDDTAVLKSFAQRAKYYIYFSSAKANIPFTPIAQKIAVGTGPLVWDTSLLPPSDDYVATIYLADDDGNKSEEVAIRNLSIIQEGFFLIDTKPPSGYVQINDADQFTRDENITVRLYGYDETTGVHSMQFIESDQDDIEGPAESFANVKYWKLTEDDGIKTLKVKLQDYGANRSAQETRTFRVLFELNNEDIADIALQYGDPTSIWLAKNGDVPGIYRFNPHNAFITKVNEPINAIAIFEDILYVAVQTSDSTALVYRWTGFILEEMLSLSAVDSEVISLHAFRNKLFLGCKNGNLYSYDGSSATIVHVFGVPLQRLYSDNSLLYIVPRNSKKLFVYDGATFTEVAI